MWICHWYGYVNVFSREQILLYITSSHGWLVHTYRCKSFDRFHGAAERSDALILPRPFHLLLTINKQYQYQWMFIFVYFCLFICLLFVVLCLTREHFNHVETLPLLVKGYTDLTCARHLWLLSREGSLSCDIYCMWHVLVLVVTSEKTPKFCHLLRHVNGAEDVFEPGVPQESCLYIGSI